MVCCNAWAEDQMMRGLSGTPESHSCKWLSNYARESFCIRKPRSGGGTSRLPNLQASFLSLARPFENQWFENLRSLIHQREARSFWSLVVKVLIKPKMSKNQQIKSKPATTQQKEQWSVASWSEQWGFGIFTQFLRSYAFPPLKWGQDHLYCRNAWQVY